ncbi:hypothetical protein GJAV_G00074970 [Gymnothorax javanicus]|nr:hypothetical protein GJAV_G00074970 [Gymnothorax javanicus]
MLESSPEVPVPGTIKGRSYYKIQRNISNQGVGTLVLERDEVRNSAPRHSIFFCGEREVDDVSFPKGDVVKSCTLSGERGTVRGSLRGAAAERALWFCERRCEGGGELTASGA